MTEKACAVLRHGFDVPHVAGRSVALGLRTAAFFVR